MSAPAVFAFNNALVRTPCHAIVDGLRAVDIGAPSYQKVLAEHKAYVEALEAAGVTVEILPALDAYPDSMFVEDPALVFTEGAIVMRPGAQSRFGEAAEIAPVLRRRFQRVIDLQGPGFADGGDILVLQDRVMIGWRIGKTYSYEIPKIFFSIKAIMGATSGDRGPLLVN